MKNKSFLSLLFWALFLVAIGSACQTESDIEVDPPLSTTVAINLEATSTSTVIPTATSTLTPTPLPSATPTVAPTATPSPTPTPITPEFANLQLALDYDKVSSELLSPQNYFPAGVSYLAAVFDYTVPSQSTLNWHIYKSKQTSEASGSFNLTAGQGYKGFVMELSEGLDEGTYQLALELDGQIVLSQPFEVYWNPTIWPISIGLEANSRGEIIGKGTRFPATTESLFASYPTINFLVGDEILAEWFVNGEKLGEQRLVWSNREWSTGIQANRINNQLEPDAPLPLGQYELLIFVNGIPKQCQTFEIVESTASNSGEDSASNQDEGCTNFVAEPSPRIPSSTNESDPWSRYEARTLTELDTLTSSAIDSGSQQNALYLEMSPDYQYPSRVRVIFTGDFRATSGLRLEGIKIWLATFAPQLTAEEAALIFGQEVRIIEENQEYWLPVQNVLVPLMEQELAVGDEFEVLITWMGATITNNQIERIYLVNAFE
ncbi:MAG: hypothetical protein OT477_17285 [Chloroflexi bacterium]|nr:hypothetical protein [Chloroflexota bacterium]